MNIRKGASGRAETAASKPRSAVTAREVPRAGDVLASRRTARSDVYSIGLVAGAPRIERARYSEAIAAVCEIARRQRVDGWFTCDHRHYVRVARFRQE